MRLRAEITTDFLARIVQILNACGTDVIIHFSPEEVSFHVPHDGTQIGIWVGSQIACCFNKYDVVSKMENQVSLKTNLSQLAQSVALDQPSIQMVLGRKNDSSYLQFTHKALDSLKQLEHRIPILIVSPSTVAQYAEPDWGAPTMKAKFPSLRSVMTWCNSAKSISSYLLLSIVKDATTGTIDVGFRVENDVVSVATKFTDLAIADADDLDVDVDCDECDVLVDMKKFLKILKVNVLMPVILILYIYDKKSVRLHFQAQAGSSTTSLTYALGATSR
jgi:hypothetical protein